MGLCTRSSQRCVTHLSLLRYQLPAGRVVLMLTPISLSESKCKCMLCLLKSTGRSLSEQGAGGCRAGCLGYERGVWGMEEVMGYRRGDAYGRGDGCGGGNGVKASCTLRDSSAPRLTKLFPLLAKARLVISVEGSCALRSTRPPPETYRQSCLAIIWGLGGMTTPVEAAVPNLPAEPETD